MTRSRAWFERRMRELTALVRRLPASRQRALAEHLDAAAAAEDAEALDPPQRHDRADSAALTRAKGEPCSRH